MSGCDSAGDRDGTALTVGDSLATAREIAASLTGAPTSGTRTYIYRGLYAGMTRAALESRFAADLVAPGEVCGRDASRTTETRCTLDVRVAPSGTSAHVEVVYSAEGADAEAREISVTRELPLDVNGVAVARALADAFERQTTLLDRREASFGHHQALIHIGTMNGARQNFAEVTVQSKLGREVLTVRLSRAPPSAARRS